MMCIGVVLFEFILVGFAELLDLNCFPPNLRKFQSIFFFFFFCSIHSPSETTIPHMVDFDFLFNVFSCFSRLDKFC